MPTLKYRDPADGEFKPLVGGSGGGGTTTVDGLPLGAILPYPSATPPADWLLCDGAAIPAEYADLIALIGANTPNLLGKFVAGAGTGSYAVGATGGADTVGLSLAEMPGHGHGGGTGWGGTHGHVNSHPLFTDYNGANQDGALTGFGGGRNVTVYPGQGIAFAVAVGDHNHPMNYEGSNAAHENRPPYVALTYIIKAKLADVVATPGDYATKAYTDSLTDGKVVRAGAMELTGFIPGNGALDSQVVNFGFTFAQPPVVTMTARTNGYCVATVTGPPNTTGFSTNIYNLHSADATLFGVDWIAVGVPA